MENKKLTKRFTKTLFSAVLTIVLALSMIGGATYALFTSTSSVNVAITSATVQVKATPKNLEIYSPKLINLDGTVLDNTNVANQETKTFVGGGTAVLEGNTITLERIAPGDSVSFDIDYANQSNIDVLYRLSIIGKGLDSTNPDGHVVHGAALLGALRMTFSENDKEPVTYNHIKTYISEWRELPAAMTTPSTMHVKLELPAECGNEYQHRACQITFQISAVQSNANVADSEIVATAEEPYIEYIKPVFTAQELRKSILSVEPGQSGSFVLGEDISTPALSQTVNANGQLVGDLSIDNKDISLDLDGYSLNMTNVYGECALIKNNSTLSIKNGTVSATRGYSYQPMFFVGGSTSGSAANVDTLELENVNVNYTVNTASKYNVNNGWSTLISSNATNANAQSNVIINNSTLNVNGPMLAALYLPNKGTRTLNNCTITGDRLSTSLFICGGDWNINGGSFVGNKYELGGNLDATNAAIQNQIIDQTDVIWEGPITISGSNYPGGIVGYHSGGFGTGDAVCIVNRDTANYQIGSVNINGAKFVIGDVALTGDALTNASVGTAISGPSGYGVRIVDVKTNIGAISISNISVTSSKLVIKGETSNSENVLPYINVISAGEGDTRVYQSANEYTAPARGTGLN